MCLSRRRRDCTIHCARYTGSRINPRVRPESRTVMESVLAVQLLEEQSAEAFQFDLNGVGWRQCRLSRDEIAAARRSFAVSFGSCSFTEPIDDLRSLHLL